MEMSFSMQVVCDDLRAIISQFNQTYKEQMSKDMLSCQNEAISVLDSIKDSATKPTSSEELIAELNRKKDNGEISEPAYDLIIGIL